MSKKNKTSSQENHYKFSWSLAKKDIQHNRFSSALIILVIASICLPMLILTSLREGYVKIMKEMIDDTPQAKRVDVVLSDVTRDTMFFNSENLAKYKKKSFIETTIPHRTKPALIVNSEDEDERFDIVSTIPDDPDLKRFGFEGTIEGKEDLVVIMHQDDILELLGFDSIPKTIELIIERGHENYSLNCELAGTVKGGERKKIYAPIQMLNKLEQWIMGYAVPEPYNLPPHLNKEEVIGRPAVDTCLVISRFPLNQKQLRTLDVQDLDYTIIKSDIVNEALSIVYYKDGSKITDGQRSAIEDILSTDFSPLVLPVLRPLAVKFNNQSFEFESAITADSRIANLLARGRWFDTYDSRFDIIVPDELVDESAELPIAFEANIGGEKVKLNIVGTTKGKNGYMDYNTLYLLNLLNDGEVEVDVANERFQIKDDIEAELNRYLVARIHARSLDDVLTVADFFQEKGYEIYGSSEADIKAYKDMKRALTSFVLLITILGGIACVAALFVLMYEAIKRKKNQIGIMRAMGLTEKFVTQIFIWQSLFYALVGYLISFVIFLLLRLTLDSSVGHTIAGIPSQEQSIFKMSFFTFLLFVLSVILVSYIAGRSAAQSIKDIHPADILADN